jgi:hypothetical protein
MALHGRTFRLGAALVAGSLLLGGCQNMSDTQLTQAQGTFGGAGIGAAIGAMAGGGRGALIGSAIGALVGLTAGTAIAHRKQQYADAESFYEAQIHQTQTTNLQLARYNQDLSQQVAQYRRDVATLQTQIRAGNADYQAASRTQARIQASHAESAKMLEDSKKELELQRQVAEELRRTAGEQSSRTQRENEQVAALANHVSVLQQQVETMASQSNQLQQFR